MLTNDCTICLSYTRVNKEDRVASQFSKCKDRTVQESGCTQGSIPECRRNQAAG
jgi:hypothetical protein